MWAHPFYAKYAGRVANARLLGKRRNVARRLFSRAVKLFACLMFAFAIASPHVGIIRPPAAKKTIRVMSYNIHHGEGMDGKIDLARIAEVILNQQADVVALQEVDRLAERTARRDLIAELAALTRMNYAFGKNIDYQGGDYGNAILTRFPIIKHQNHHYKMLRAGEQRGLLEAVLKVEGKQLLFLNTHLDYRRDDAERLSNVDEINQILEQRKGLPVILCGDFNDTPNSPTHQKVEGTFVDTWKRVGKGEGFSYPSAQPQKRIDYIFTNKERAFVPVKAWLIPVRAWVVESNASDHLPVVVEFKRP